MPAIRASFRDGVLDLCGGTGTREGLRSLFPLIDAGHSGSVAPHWGRWPGGGGGGGGGASEFFVFVL